MAVDWARGSPLVAVIALLFLIIIGLCMCFLYIDRERENEAAQKDLMENADLSPTSARRMIKLARINNYTLNNHYSVSSSDRSTNQGNLMDILEHEFFMVNRWIKQLELAKRAPDPDAMHRELNRLIDAMVDHIDKFNITEKKRREIFHLCQQMSENSMQKYDNYFVKCVA